MSAARLEKSKDGYGGVDALQARTLKPLDEGSRRLKKRMAEWMPDDSDLKVCLKSRYRRFQAQGRKRRP
jgi:hypothetical protein